MKKLLDYIEIGYKMAIIIPLIITGIIAIFIGDICEKLIGNIKPIKK